MNVDPVHVHQRSLFVRFRMTCCVIHQCAKSNLRGLALQKLHTLSGLPFLSSRPQCVQALSMGIYGISQHDHDIASSILPLCLPWLDRSVQMLPRGFQGMHTEGVTVTACSVCKRTVLCELIDSGSHETWCW